MGFHLGRFLKGAVKTAIKANPIGNVASTLLESVQGSGSSHPAVTGLSDAITKFQHAVNTGEITSEERQKMDDNATRIRMAEIEAQAEMHSDQMELWQSELEHGDKFTANTRPTVVRIFAWKLAIMGAIIFLANCFLFLAWMKKYPDAPTTSFTPLLGDVLIWIVVFEGSALLAYFGVRGFEKITRHMSQKGLSLFGKSK